MSPHRAAELELIDTLATLLRSLIAACDLDPNESHVEFDGEVVSVQSVLDFADDTSGIGSSFEVEFRG